MGSLIVVGCVAAGMIGMKAGIAVKTVGVNMEISAEIMADVRRRVHVEEGMASEADQRHTLSPFSNSPRHGGANETIHDGRNVAPCQSDTPRSTYATVR